MLTDNNQIFRNWFVIIHHLTKVLAQIIQRIIFELNELSITLSVMFMLLYGETMLGTDTTVAIYV